MALDDFNTGDEYSEGNVTTRKKPKNISIKENEWKWLIINEPSWASAFGKQLDIKEAKCFVQMMDDVLGGEKTPYGTPSEDKKEEIRNYRSKLIDHIKELED